MKKAKQKLHNVKNYPIRELEFLEECFKQVNTCRKVLKWTHVAFYYAIDLEDHETSFFQFQVDEL